MADGRRSVPFFSRFQVCRAFLAARSPSQTLAATRVAASGRKWPQVAASGLWGKWPQVAASGLQGKWPQVAAPASSKQVAASGRKWPQVAASGRRASGRKWPQVAPGVHRRSSRKWPQVLQLPVKGILLEEGVVKDRMVWGINVTVKDQGNHPEMDKIEALEDHLVIMGWDGIQLEVVLGV
eukprot:s3116_g8.t1